MGKHHTDNQPISTDGCGALHLTAAPTSAKWVSRRILLVQVAASGRNLNKKGTTKRRTINQCAPKMLSRHPKNQYAFFPV